MFFGSADHARVSSQFPTFFEKSSFVHGGTSHQRDHEELGDDMAHLSESFSTLKTAGLVEPLVHQTSAKSA
jgi:hypothetical protein